MHYFEPILSRYLDEDINDFVTKERQASIKNVIFAVADNWEVTLSLGRRCPCCGQNIPPSDSKLFLYKNGCITKVITIQRRFLQPGETIMECAERISKKELPFIKIIK